jgi:FkbH-like protein
LLRPWDVSCAAYNNILAELATLGSSASAPGITHLICLFDTDAMLGDALYGAGTCDLCEAYLSALEHFTLRHPDKVVITHTFCIGSNRWLGFADVTHRASQKALEAALNTRIALIAKAHPNLFVFDIELLFRRHGEDALLSNAFWYAGRIRYTQLMFDLLAQTLRKALDAYAQKQRKVLVLDLDNTLWGGIVGEVGAQGIALSEEGSGRCYRDFQRCLKALQKTGVLLAICSKNNPADVDEVFADNSMMLLRRDDFAAIHVNWESKPDNIARIAEHLNLATDSFVYIDDNPAEREAVSRFLPEVAVPTFPNCVEDLPTWFMREIVPAYFSKYMITDEDARRTEQYRANEGRRKLIAAFDLDSYLAELGIECSIHVDASSRLIRAAQMTQKTNQFNLTSRRYEVTDLARFAESPEHAVLMLDYRDRFGEEGAVGLAIVDLTEGRIDTFLTSCRVIGRKTEHRLLDKAVELCTARGHRRILGEYIPTRKNQLAADFYELHGFKLSAEHPDGRRIYEKTIA